MVPQDSQVSYSISSSQLILPPTARLFKLTFWSAWLQTLYAFPHPTWHTYNHLSPGRILLVVSKGTWKPGSPELRMSKQLSASFLSSTPAQTTEQLSCLLLRPMSSSELWSLIIHSLLETSFLISLLFLLLFLHLITSIDMQTMPTLTVLTMSPLQTYPPFFHIGNFDSNNNTGE